jgi:plasmid stability protein
MAALTLRNIPDDLYQDLKQQAVSHHRSLNKEVVYLLEQALTRDTANDMDWLRRAEALRGSLDIPPLNDEMLNQAKNEGRP